MTKLGELRALCQTYYDRVCQIENDKYDTEKRVEFKEYEVINYLITLIRFTILILISDY